MAGYWARAEAEPHVAAGRRARVRADAAVVWGRAPVARARAIIRWNTDNPQKKKKRGGTQTRGAPSYFLRLRPRRPSQISGRVRRQNLAAFSGPNHGHRIMPAPDSTPHRPSSFPLFLHHVRMASVRRPSSTSLDQGDD